MPWPAIPFNQTAAAQAKFKDQFSPSLIVLDCEATIICANAIEDVMATEDTEELLAIWTSLTNLDYYDNIDNSFDELKAAHDEKMQQEVRPSDNKSIIPSFYITNEATPS